MTTTATAVAEFEAQGVLQPGDTGWWKVWGASWADVRPGDLVVTATTEFVVEDRFTAQSPARIGIVADGERFTMGALVPLVLVRRGDRNTLAGSVR